MKKTTKLLIILLTLVAVCVMSTVAASAETVIIDPELIFNPQVSLNVLADGTASETLSGTYPYGEKTEISAPLVDGKTFQYWTNGEGKVVSYNEKLTLTLYAHTTVQAVYGTEAAVSSTVAAFLNVTRTDGEIVFNAISSSATAGIRYSTTKTTLEDLKGDTDVTVAPADGTPNWTLVLTPEDETTVYYAVVYATVGTETTYSEVKAVSFSELSSGVTMVANTGNIELPDIDLEFCNVTFDPNGGNGMMTPQGVVKNQPSLLVANTFSNGELLFKGWNTAADGSGTDYTDGQSVTIDADMTLYAQWETSDEHAASEANKKILELLAQNDAEGYNKELIAQARATYEELTDEQKALVPELTYRLLRRAEMTMTPLTGDPNLLPLWVSLIVLSLGGIVTVTLYCRKKKASGK